jgi:O-antigen/teichoic acid export membrane protein
MLKNTLTVLKGTVVAQALGFMALPFLSRVFAPEAFGMFQLYQSILSLLLVFAAMRFEVALLSANDGVELVATAQLCGIINVIIALITLIICGVVWIYPGSLTVATQQVLWFMPIAVLLGGALQTLGYLALRHREFGHGASAKMAQASGYLGTSIGFGAIAPISYGLIIADLVGRLVSIVSLILRRSIIDSACFRRPKKSELFSAARKFIKFPLVSVPGGLINAGGAAITSVLMYGFFDASVSGQYGLVERSLMLPVGMIAVAVSQVFTADLSAIVRDGGTNASALLRTVMGRMFMLGIVPASIVALFGPFLFTLIFGEKWKLAGEFARILAPLALASLVSGSVNMAIMILGWQKVQFGWEVARLLVVSLAWICIVNFNLKSTEAVALHCIASVSMSVLYLWLADFMLRRHGAHTSSTGSTKNQ